MNKGTKITLLILAALLIAAGIGAAIFAIATESDKAGNAAPDSNENTKLHDDVEYVYDEKGNIKSERYYKDNEYIGQRDYYTTESAEYITVFDKDGREVESSIIEFNARASITKKTIYKFHLLSEVAEYEYYHDLTTVAKRTVKTYVGDDVYAEKTYFSENAKKTRHCTFLNDEMIEDTYFDENGNVIENGGETIEE